MARELYGDPTIGGEDPGEGFDHYLDDEQPARLVVADASGPVGMGGPLAPQPEERRGRAGRGHGAAPARAALELTEAWSYEPRERLADRPFRV